MRITFVLPMFLESPSGGFKVVYEYANRLRQRGHEVVLVHPRNIVDRRARRGPNWLMGWLVELVKSRLWGLRLRWRHRRQPIPWFPLEAGIEVRLVRDLRERFIPDGDVILATAFQTAGPVAGYGPKKGRGYYLIQSYENWMGEEAAVQASWRLPLRKIVVSRWLERIAATLGEAERTIWIPLGLDGEQFRVTRPLTERVVPRIGMLAHPLPLKGTADGLAALEMVRREFPAIEAVLFGTEPRPATLPEWIEYRQRPRAAELVELYNSCRIFLHPSHLEGWGLPAAEAMACGCALVAAHNDGVDEFASDGRNALLAPVRSPARLAELIGRLLRDDRQRLDLAAAGAREMRRFDWKWSVDRLEALLDAEEAG